MGENKHVLRSAQTQARLLEVARALFVARGYQQVSAEEIVQQAGLTRGALYHHFDGKDGLFKALYDQLQCEVTTRINAAYDAAPDPLSAFRVSCHVWLEACTDREVQQVVLIDAPNVLSWEAWRAADAEYSLGDIRECLHGLSEQGMIAHDGLDALTHLLVGGMNEMALYIARAPDAHTALADAKRWLDVVLDGIMNKPRK
ncbi:MAG: TetR/AcrR family transcriptional regulator [Chloroflexota bacterium]|nr:TetR/AcrR family transcriptional regulator [Chloroflexota bacterium]